MKRTRFFTISAGRLPTNTVRASRCSLVSASGTNFLTFFDLFFSFLVRDSWRGTCDESDSLPSSSCAARTSALSPSATSSLAFSALALDESLRVFAPFAFFSFSDLESFLVVSESTRTFFLVLSCSSLFLRFFFEFEDSFGASALLLALNSEVEGPAYPDRLTNCVHQRARRCDIHCSGK